MVLLEACRIAGMLVGCLCIGKSGRIAVLIHRRGRSLPDSEGVVVTTEHQFELDVTSLRWTEDKSCGSRQARTIGSKLRVASNREHVVSVPDISRGLTKQEDSFGRRGLELAKIALWG